MEGLISEIIVYTLLNKADFCQSECGAWKRGYRTGFSPLLKVAQESVYSIFHPPPSTVRSLVSYPCWFRLSRVRVRALIIVNASG